MSSAAYLYLLEGLKVIVMSENKQLTYVCKVGSVYTLVTVSYDK